MFNPVSFYGAPPAPYNPPPLAAATPGVGPMRPPPPMGIPAAPPSTPQQISTEAEETAQTQFLLAKHNDILPSSVEQSAISALVGKVKQNLDKIIVAPETFSSVAIEEVREVGSYKKGTMLAKHNVADLVIVLKTLPLIESINALGQKIVLDLKAENHADIFGCVIRDFGCEIAGTHAVVRVLITIMPQLAAQLDKDLHLPEKELLRNMGALRHARWFEENASHSVVKALIRLLKHLKKKHEGLKPLNVWCTELLAHYCVMNTPTRNPLPLALAFRRFFQVLASGILLPNSPALVDPCDAPTRIHYALSLEEMDMICSTAQTLLRIILHGGTEQLFAGEGTSSVSTEMSIWENVMITPLEKAYSEVDMQPYYGEEPQQQKVGGDSADAGDSVASAAAVQA
uniref:DZF domain-containing protein n=1 Tax=Globodera rostochiensis TaxID=31243 RepID=A0A914IC70_GLORO